MSDLALPMEVRVPADRLKSIFAIYDQGLYLQAFRQAEQFGPLAQWRGTEARILVGRLAGNLGSTRLANWHFIHAFRKDRTHPEALWFFTRYLLGSRGPLAAWNFVQGRTFPADARANCARTGVRTRRHPRFAARFRRRRGLAAQSGGDRR